MPPPPKRILIIRPSALGDVCRSVPVLVSLRRAHPLAEIDWLVQDTFAPAVEAHPALTGVVPFQRSELGRRASRGKLGTSLTFLKRLRSRHYDLVFDMQGLARSGLFALATRAPRRVGFSDSREFGWLGLNERYAVGAVHSVDRMLGLLGVAGIDPVLDLRLYVPQPDKEWAATDPRLGMPYVVIAPTSRWPGKRWPTERFAELTEKLLCKGDIKKVVLVGANSERDQCSALLAVVGEQPQVIDLIGKTTVGGLMAVIERSALVIANDSAALHMAVGFQRPIVALFGPTRTERVGPYGRTRDVIQHVLGTDNFDHKNEISGRELMERISVDEVYASACQRITR